MTTAPDSYTAAEDHVRPHYSSQARSFLRTILMALLVLITTLAITGWVLTQAPSGVTDTRYFTVAPGSSVRSIAEQAAEEGLVRSSFALYAVLLLQYEPESIYAGTYALPEPLNVFELANRLASKETELDLTRITLPEGLPARYMATIIAEAVPAITPEAYRAAASSSEGRLFPETYLVPPDITEKEMVTLQKDTFAAVQEELLNEYGLGLLPFSEVITLASIVEREANDELSMRTVAGIFLNRLELGMPLQADASIEYALDVPLNELREGELAAQLRELDSPYNTYLNNGLPPTPIGNPGRQALAAVLNPIETNYLYYLTGTDGGVYYAETLAEHNQNIDRYLR